MSDPIARPQKRMATLVGAGIAAMLSPSGKIISSAAAAGLIVAAVATQVVDQAPSTVSMAAKQPASAPLPVSHVTIPTGDGSEMPVMLSETVSTDVFAPTDPGHFFKSVIPVIQVAPQVMASASTPMLITPPAPPPGVRGGPGAPLPQPGNGCSVPPCVEPPPMNGPDAPPGNGPEPRPEPPGTPNGPGEPGQPTPKAPDPQPGQNPPPGPRTPVPKTPDPMDPNLPDPAGPIVQATLPLNVAPLAVAAVPEPGMLGLMLLGLGGLAMTARRRRS